MSKFGILNPFYRHGFSSHALHRLWSGIKSRCYNRKEKSYKDYGGRGIRMCLSWKNDFVVFRDWALTHGWKPGLEINRKDNDRGYAPWNCEFVTREVNCNNRRSNVLIEIFGEIKNITQWSRDPRCVVSFNAFYMRILRGWNPEKALTTPVRIISKAA